MAKIKNLEQLFAEQLQDIYYAEKKLTKALPKMAKKANSPKLSQAFTKHLEETKSQIEKLEQVMNSCGVKVKGKKCEAIEGLIKEAEELMSDSEKSEVLDAAIIAAAQKVEHYEMATYGTLCAWAKQLGLTTEGKTLHSIYDQEQGADEKLSELAESGINLKGQMARAA